MTRIVRSVVRAAGGASNARMRRSCGTPYRFLPRTSNRCAVHSEPPRSSVAELPCQPQVQVMVCAWCLYSSITCLKGSTVVGDLTGGRLFTRTPARYELHAESGRGPLILLDCVDSCTFQAW